MDLSLNGNLSAYGVVAAGNPTRVSACICKE
jgi:hypothetical protein